MKIYLATWLLEPAQADHLTNAKNKNRLISYYHTKQKGKELSFYTLTGRCPKQ